jgi:hypothetical protein
MVISRSKPRNSSQTIDLAIQILWHVAIRNFAYALSRRKLSHTVGAGGNGFSPRAERGETKHDVLRQFARKLRRVRGLYGLTV